MQFRHQPLGSKMQLESTPLRLKTEKIGEKCILDSVQAVWLELIEQKAEVNIWK